MHDITGTPSSDVLVCTINEQSPLLLLEGLRSGGLSFQLTTSTAFVMRAAANGPPGVVLLIPHRLFAPGGIETLRELRSLHAVPCIIQAASADSAQERVAALDAGADEVLHAGMPVAEVIARIQAVLRRTRGTVLPASWRLLASGRILEAPNNEPQRLTSAEYALLSTLAAAAGEPVDRDAISERVFRRSWSPLDRAVDSLVKRLRRKLPPDAIQSVRGVGYALTGAIEFVPNSVKNCALHTVLTSSPIPQTYNKDALIHTIGHPNGKD